MLPIKNEAIAAQEVIADLRNLSALTSDENGAQRVAWTPVWDRALEWFIKKMRALGAEISVDSAHNVFATLPGESTEALCIGSHLDSVPGGGWLDGALGVVAGMGILRRYAVSGKRPRKTLVVASWADEEGARFGRSCVGSSAASGTLNPHDLATLHDADGGTFPEALSHYSKTLDDFSQAAADFSKRNIHQYLELHIEQAPVLEGREQSVAAVRGICGCRREYITFHGQRAHLGSPIDKRHDAFLAAAEATLAFREIARTLSDENDYAYCTVGEVSISPNVINVVPDTCILSLDMRTFNEGKLRQLHEKTHAACEKAAANNKVTVHYETIWDIPPTHFDPALIQCAQTIIRQETGRAETIVSAPLHDAAEMAKIMPAEMVFIRSNAGHSHCKEENTDEDALIAGITAFMQIADHLLNE